MKRLTSIFVLLFLILGVTRAQDTLTVVPPRDSTFAEGADTTRILFGESVLGLKMQPRYRPINQPFHKGGFLANTYVNVIVAPYRIFADNYSNGPVAIGSLGKWLSPYHGVQVGAGFGSFVDNYEADRMGLIMARASYLFNLSSFVSGYDPNRLVEFYPMAGVGASLVIASNNPASVSLSAHLGLQVNMHVFPGVDLVVEPLLEIQRDGRKLIRMDVWRGYMLGLQGGVGARIALDREHYGSDPGSDWFVTLGGGAQLQNSDLERDIRFAQAIGPHAAIGAGRYYSRCFALRVQGGYGYHFWKEIKEGDRDRYGNLLEPGRFKSSYIFFRLEGGLDFVGLFRKKEGLARFGATLFAGPEAGVMLKRDPYKADIRYPYVGGTAALQLKVRIWRGLGFYLEPRVSIVPYSAYAFKTSTVNRNYYDAVVSASAGLEYRFVKMKKSKSNINNNN